MQDATRAILKPKRARQYGQSSRRHRRILNRRKSQSFGEVQDATGGILKQIQMGNQSRYRVQDATDGILNRTRSRATGGIQDATGSILKHGTGPTLEQSSIARGTDRLEEFKAPQAAS